jgi:hypothetical protein
MKTDSREKFYRSLYVDAPLPEGYCPYSVQDKHPSDLMRLCKIASLTACPNRLCGNQDLWKDCLEISRVEPKK